MIEWRRADVEASLVPTCPADRCREILFRGYRMDGDQLIRDPRFTYCSRRPKVDGYCLQHSHKHEGGL